MKNTTMMAAMRMAAAVMMAAATGCTGLDTGNAGVAQVKFALSAAPGQPVDSTGKEFVMSRALAPVERVDLYLPAGASCVGIDGLGPAGGSVGAVCEVDKIRVNGPWMVDLLTGQATPPFPVVPVVSGTYRRVDVRFDADDDEVMLVEGTVALDSATVPFRLVVEVDEEVRFEGADIVARPDAVAEAFLKLDPTAWMATIPIAQCVAAGDLEVVNGVLELANGDGACEDIEELIEDAIENSGGLSDDDDD